MSPDNGTKISILFVFLKKSKIYTMYLLYVSTLILHRRLYNLPYWSNEPFYPNVATLRSGHCRRNFVCRLSVVFLSVCNVGAPYSGVEAFGNISSPLCNLTIL